MDESPVMVLLIEDNPGDARLIRELLREKAADGAAPLFQIAHADHLAAGLALLAQGNPAAVLLDLSLPDSQGLATLETVRAAAPDIPIVVLTGLGDEITGLKAIQAGAQDYLGKDQVDDGRLGRTLIYAIERQRLAHALWQSEESYRRIVETTREGVWTIDAESQTTFVNARMAEMLGYTVEEMMGVHLFHFMDEEGRALAAANVERRRRGIAEQHDFKFQRKDGAELWALLNTNPILDEAGVYGGALAMVTDITKRRRAEEALTRHAQQLTALHEMLLGITGQHDLPALLQSMVERAVRLLNADEGGLYLCDSGKRQCRCVVSYRTPRDYVGTLLKYGEGAAGTVAQTGQPLIVDDYRTWSGRAAVYEQEQPFQALIAMPIIWHEQVTGVLHVLRQATKPFQQAGQELLRLFAGHAAIAIENARLVQGLEHELAERRRAETRLAEQNEDLRRWKAITLGREGRVLELKHEVNALLKRLGEPPRYASAE